MRPLDWEPLAPADPLPGDPDAIAVESARLARLGDDMRTQAARLRQIGADTSEQGEHADSLRSASFELAQDLDKSADRYTRVASALKDWAPELRIAQTETLREHDKAKLAAEIRQRNTVMSAALPPGVEPSPDQISAAMTREAALADADHLLAEARRNLDRILDHAHSRGRHYAHLIDDANHILKDGKWANFKDWVDRNADWIEQYSDWLGYVATAAAIGAIFIPGANVVALGYLATTLTTTAMVATGVAAAAHLTLASTGNGSWLDVGLDVFALITLGAGLRAAKGLESAHAAMRAAAAQETRSKAAEAVVRSRRADIQLADRVARRATSSAAERRGALRLLEEIEEEAGRVGNRAAQEMLDAPLAKTHLHQRIAVGDRKLASVWNEMVELGPRFANVQGVSEAAERGARAYQVAQGNYAASMVVDLGTKASDRYASGAWPFRSTSSAW